MIESVLSMVTGILMLYFGAEGLIRGASSLAHRFGISSLIIGVTVVAIGTSLPETATSLIAHLGDAGGDIALGNVLGSNIANIALVLGVAILIHPIAVSADVKFREMPILLLVTWIFWALARFYGLNETAGIILMAIMAAYMIMQVVLAKKHKLPPEEEEELRDSAKSHYVKGLWKQLLYIAAGTAILLLGGAVLVNGAVDFARLVGLSERVIGLTIVAIGTSTPEMAASLIAARRREHEISIGNIIGSNIFNMAFTIGLCAGIKPLEFSPDLIQVDSYFMLLITTILCIWIVYFNKVGRHLGTALLLLYAFYVYLLLFPLS